MTALGSGANGCSPRCRSSRRRSHYRRHCCSTDTCRPSGGACPAKTKKKIQQSGTEKKGSERPSQKNRDDLWRNYLCMFFFSVQIGFWKITCSIWDFMQTSTRTGSSHRGNIVTQLIDLVQYLGHFLFPIQMTRCWRPSKKTSKEQMSEKHKAWER